MSTGIEWTDETWNPVTGCTKVSQGCKHCYAERLWPKVEGARVKREGGAPEPFTNVHTHPDRLDAPLHWRKPRRVFVNSMSDLFHEDIPDRFIADVFGIMAAAHWHTFQVLTKRPARALRLLNSTSVDTFEHVACGSFADMVDECAAMYSHIEERWPLPNVWLGVSVEDQATADERIPLLLQMPAAVRFISAEPLLGPINYGPWFWSHSKDEEGIKASDPSYAVDWFITGGESGPKARPSHPDWFRSLRDQCQAAGVPFFFKQWGEWSPCYYVDSNTRERAVKLVFNKREIAMGGPADGTEPVNMRHLGKRAAGRLLDGREWNEYPH